LKKGATFSTILRRDFHEIVFQTYNDVPYCVKGTESSIQKFFQEEKIRDEAALEAGGVCQ
jgi:hypothetical protein